MLTAAADPAGSIDVAAWALAQGPIGVLSLAIAYGWRMERIRADTERARADAARAGQDALIRELLDKVVPALTESTAATRDIADTIRRERERG